MAQIRADPLPLPHTARSVSSHKGSTFDSHMGRDSFDARTNSKSPHSGSHHGVSSSAPQSSPGRPHELAKAVSVDELLTMDSHEYAEPPSLTNSSSLSTRMSEPMSRTSTDDIIYGAFEMFRVDSPIYPLGSAIYPPIRDGSQQEPSASNAHESFDAMSADDYPFESFPKSSAAPDTIYNTEHNIGIARALQRPRERKTVHCTYCNQVPQGFHGEHELRRHIERHHSVIRRVWVCRNSPDTPNWLDNCKPCRSGKTYGAKNNAAAHLRRAHFNPCQNKLGGRNKKSEPSMEVLKRYICERLERKNGSNVWEIVSADRRYDTGEATMLDQPSSSDSSPPPSAMPKPSLVGPAIDSIGAGDFKEVSKDCDLTKLRRSSQGSSKAYEDIVNAEKDSSTLVNFLRQTEEIFWARYAHLPHTAIQILWQQAWANITSSGMNTGYQASFSDTSDRKRPKSPSSNMSGILDKSGSLARHVSAPPGAARKDQVQHLAPPPVPNANSGTSIYSGLALQNSSHHPSHRNLLTSSWSRPELHHISEVEEFSPAEWLARSPDQISSSPIISLTPSPSHERRMFRSSGVSQTTPHSVALDSADSLPPRAYVDVTEAILAQNISLRACSVYTADSGYYSQQGIGEGRMSRYLSEETGQTASSDRMLGITRGSPHVPDVMEILNTEHVSKSTEPHVDVESVFEFLNPSKQDMSSEILKHESLPAERVVIKVENAEQKLLGAARACEPCRLNNASCDGNIPCCNLCSDNDLKCQYRPPDDSFLQAGDNAKVLDIGRQPFSYRASMLDSFGFREAPPRFESQEISSEPVTDASSPLIIVHADMACPPGGGSPLSRVDSSVDSDGERSFIDGINDRDSLFGDEVENAHKLPKRLAASILKDFTLQLWLARRHARTTTTGDSSASSSSQSSKETCTSSSASTLASTKSSGKRPYSSEDDPDDLNNANDGGDAKRPCRVSSRKAPEKQVFACPYHRYDRERYSARNTREVCYRICSSVLLRDISRLKQHLYRVHRRPDYYCGSCYCTFDTQEEVDTHTRKRPACENEEPLFQEKMDKDQTNAIKWRSIRTEPHAEWFKIYRILFPQAVVPPDSHAYANGHSAAAVQDFLAYFESEAPMMLSEYLGEYVRDRVSLSQHTRDILDEAFEHAISRLLMAVRPRIEVLGPQSGEILTEHRQPEDVIQVQAVAETGVMTQQGLASEYTIDVSELGIDFYGEDWLLDLGSAKTVDYDT